MKQYSICILNKKFYEKYPIKQYPEILTKGEKRPYLILLIKINNVNYGIPFRSNINHKYCFIIKNNRGLKEGLDYTKSVIVQKKYIGRPAHLRSNTLPQIDQYIEIIIRDFKLF